MQLVTLRTDLGVIMQGFVLPLQNQADCRKLHPLLQPYLLLGEVEGKFGEFQRVPIHPDLLPAERAINLLREGELVKDKNRKVGKPSCEAHGYELRPATQSNDPRILVLIDTRGSRHQPNTTAGWKIVSGRAEDLVVGRCIRGNTGRGGTCYIGLVLMWPGCEIIVRPEGRAPFLLTYIDVEIGLQCDMEAVENSNKLRAAVRHERRDVNRALRLKEKNVKRASLRAKNDARRRQLEQERSRQQSRERSVRQTCIKRALKFARQLREVKDPERLAKIVRQRLTLLKFLRDRKAKAKRDAESSVHFRAMHPPKKIEGLA